MIVKFCLSRMCIANLLYSLETFGIKKKQETQELCSTKVSVSSVKFYLFLHILSRCLNFISDI